MKTKLTISMLNGVWLDADGIEYLICDGKAYYSNSDLVRDKATFNNLKIILQSKLDLLQKEINKMEDLNRLRPLKKCEAKK